MHVLYIYGMVHAGPNNALLGEAKAHEPVLAAMRKHAGVAVVQKAACKCLCNMSAKVNWFCAI